ncbi:MAG: hypothetical protein J7K11_02360 [Candidatus Hydrothermae bacterium]|nr:hypothetical protein [Candidatus Hydrothermae bacterium]
MLRKLTFSVLIFVLSGGVRAGRYEALLQRLDRAADMWDRDSLINVHDEVYEYYQLEEENEARVLLGIADFWLSSYYWNSDRDSSKVYLEEFVEVVEEVPEEELTSDDLAFLGYCYNTLIPLRGFTSAPSLGKKSSDAFKRARAKGPDNPRVYLLRGISVYRRPKSFGGGAGKALPLLNRSLELCNDDKGPVKWGKRVALVHKALALKDLGREDEALSVLKSAVAEFPDFGWANSLLARWSERR